MPSLEQIRAALSEHEPAVITADDVARAAVAMVLREALEGPEVLFIERAKREGDPWSGHMAFPGGRVEPDDAHVREAAERETLEEVGLSLVGAEPLGRLDDKQGNPVSSPRLVISAWVYRVEDSPPLAPNHEVQEAFWFPLRQLRDAARHIPYESPRAGLEFPGILVGEPDRHVVWGLTYSFLESFFLVVGRPLPDRWTEKMRQYARHVHDRGTQ